MQGTRRNTGKLDLVAEQEERGIMEDSPSAVGAADMPSFLCGGRGLEVCAEGWSLGETTQASEPTIKDVFAAVASCSTILASLNMHMSGFNEDMSHVRHDMKKITEQSKVAKDRISAVEDHLPAISNDLKLVSHAVQALLHKVDDFEK